MKIFTNIFLILFATISFGQNNFWQNKDLNSIPDEDIINYDTQVNRFSVFELDKIALSMALKDAPLRFDENSSDVLIQVPYSDEKFGIFEIFEVQTLAPSLALKYPNIKSYIGKHRGSNSDRLRLTITPQGVFVKIFSSTGSIYINPMTQNGLFYKVFYAKDAVFPDFNCDFESIIENAIISNSSSSVDAVNVVDDSTFRIYRLAGATNGEYSTFHVNQAGISSGTTNQKKSAILATMTVSLDRVNGILENEIAVNLQFISNTDSFIFLDPTTDPYSDPNSTNVILNENNNFMPGAVGDANYDIGHVFTTAPGGVAFVGALCNDAIKAGGVSGSSSPVGDGFDLILAHEIGHQLGASHSYNNSCNGNRSDNSVYEVGSGVTIMSYAGICSPNVQNSRFDYYHSGSLLQIFSVISNTSCAQTSTISNNPPTITPNSNYTIPKRTPFVLDAQATDIDGDDLTYNWEQFDNQISIQPPTSSSVNGPLFRNFRPSTSSLRYFPKIETILNNQNQTTWEVLPNVVRSMNFVVVARDNNILGGQNTQDLLTVNVANAGPFRVTSQDISGISWSPGSTQTITWNVAGTDANGINANQVDILLSTNEGVTFEHVLAQNTPNDGSENITVPFGVVGNKSRIMVKASNNIFFSLNEEFISVNAICEEASNNSVTGIPDGLGLFGPSPGTPGESVINISQDDIVDNLSVNLTLNHDSLSDIDVELESPDGDIVQLWSHDLCSANGLDLRFVSGGNPLPTSGCESIITGNFEPVGSLSDFKNTSTLGNWTLRVTDFFVGNLGNINSWSIEVCSAEFLDSEDFNKDIFTLYPNPANGFVILQFNQTSENADVKIYDLNGRLVKHKILDNFSQSQRLDINELNRGIYLVKVNQNISQTVKKLIVN
ncbi:zinc-dependent metalloprotease [Flavobacterium sp. CS20]|uniref:zinc-dependent metalloprotease n=1 Tax=Flavobacterium sp. CS20 TaxID=2775246 RepID=UPI001B3A0CF7|nr:zinc-dependent metalloprotease [Flavobacterium sp. CS20]QTY27535.1 T9SS type A sorting domain-containing protein [Flavobacterium sp. CS20]